LSFSLPLEVALIYDMHVMRLKTTIALAGLLTFPLTLPAQEADRPDLSGNWTLNEPMSETMREKMTELMEEELANPRARARWDRTRTRERARLSSAPFAGLSIEHEEPRVAIEYSGGRVRELFTDGRELEPDPQFGVEGLTVSWEGARLIVDAETARGRMTEFWEISEDGQRLFVTTSVEMPQRFEDPVSFRRTYDRQAKTAEEAAAAEAEAGAEEGQDEDDG
jgi:hypothetical protein